MFNQKELDGITKKELISKIQQSEEKKNQSTSSVERLLIEYHEINPLYLALTKRSAKTCGN